MIYENRLLGWMSGVLCGGLLALAVVPALAEEEPVERTNFTVAVVENDSGQPIGNAHITLQFSQPRKFRRGKPTAYSAKTNPQGRCKFLDIPKGTIRLIVTAEHHQSFGRNFQLKEDNQVFEVKMKKPQPLL